jgi:N6-L-threonylcarbamoyladenine synthase
VLVLGIETSCDDTGVAIVEDGCRVRANLVGRQLEHAAYGGVVPEIAARKHVEVLPALLESALDEAGTDLGALDGIAVTRGPGLIGALLAGWCFGRGLAHAHGLPWVGVHHLAAHVHGALMPALEAGERVEYPLVAMVVSGGHTALYHVSAEGRFRLLGKTRDDAAGEAYDKVSTLLGLGYPGGPVIDRLAPTGDATGFRLPRPDLGLDFSFSGLKTAVRRAALAEGLRPGRPEDPRVLALVASFQAAVVDILAETTERALDAAPARGLVLSGGVAANSALRERFARLAERRGIGLHRSPPALSTDNAAMIAGLGHGRLARGERDGVDLAALATWPMPERVA